MQRATTSCAALLAIMMASAVGAQELKSGLAAGRTMISMPIEKVAGVNDGVKPGDEICYT